MQQWVYRKHPVLLSPELVLCTWCDQMSVLTQSSIRWYCVNLSTEWPSQSQKILHEIWKFVHWNNSNDQTTYKIFVAMLHWKWSMSSKAVTRRMHEIVEHCAERIRRSWDSKDCSEIIQPFWISWLSVVHILYFVSKTSHYPELPKPLQLRLDPQWILTIATEKEMISDCWRD